MSLVDPGGPGGGPGAAQSAVVPQGPSPPWDAGAAMLVLRKRHYVCAALLTAQGDPSNHKEAMLLDEAKWRPSEAKEIKALRRNESFTEVDRSELPKGRRLVRMTWVYKTKRDGTKKSRLCAQGCSQVPGVDYNQTLKKNGQVSPGIPLSWKTQWPCTVRG